MKNSVSPAFDLDAVTGSTDGALDTIEYVDPMPGFMPHPHAQRGPLGAPLVASGWIVDPVTGGEPRAVSVVLDGTRAHDARVGLARRDVAQSRPDLPEEIGFRAILRTDDLLPGDHELRAYALGDDGAWYEGGHWPFRLWAAPRPELPRTPRHLRIKIDHVADLAGDGASHGPGSPVAGERFAVISGWAVDAHARRGVAAVAAFDELGGVWCAPCDIPRPDVRAVVRADEDRLGFDIVVPADALGRGRHQLRVAGFDETGRLFEGGTKVTVDVAGVQRPFPGFLREYREPPRAAAAVTVFGADGPAEPCAAGAAFAASVRRGATVVFDGWALDAAARAATVIYVELVPAVAGVLPHRFPALAGFRRDRRPAAVPPPPVDDAWFRGQIATAAVTPGTYALTLAVLDDDRRGVARLALGRLTVRRARRPGSGGT